MQTFMALLQTLSLRTWPMLRLSLVGSIHTIYGLVSNDYYITLYIKVNRYYITFFYFAENKLDLLRLLHPIRYKWRQIGQSLKISHGDLENVCDERRLNTDRLSDVIQIWFDKQPSDVTWGTIKIAVELPRVFEPSIAASIKHYLAP